MKSLLQQMYNSVALQIIRVMVVFGGMNLTLKQTAFKIINLEKTGSEELPPNYQKEMLEILKQIEINTRK